MRKGMMITLIAVQVVLVTLFLLSGIYFSRERFFHEDMVRRISYGRVAYVYRNVKHSCEVVNATGNTDLSGNFSTFVLNNEGILGGLDLGVDCVAGDINVSDLNFNVWLR
jgi:hypothetical protein